MFFGAKISYEFDGEFVCFSGFRWIWALSVYVSEVLVCWSSRPDFVPVLLISFFFWRHSSRSISCRRRYNWDKSIFRVLWSISLFVCGSCRRIESLLAACFPRV
jgi:hypothetical protein